MNLFRPCVGKALCNNMLLVQGALFTTAIGQIFAFVAVLAEFITKFDVVSFSINVSFQIPSPMLHGLLGSQVVLPGPAAEMQP